ncbi:Cytochrome oxidase maturation protein cbb3-type [compost metagenome]
MFNIILGMSVIYLLISISILVAIGFFIAFIRAVKTGQYDDDYTPSVRMLFDDELKIENPKSIQTTEEKQI